MSNAEDVRNSFYDDLLFRSARFRMKRLRISIAIECAGVFA